MGSSKYSITFRIFQGDRLVREEHLTQSVIKVGKVPSAHLRIDDESVSRMHAIIEVTGSGDVSIIDLGSTRGTFVNGQKINKAKLRTGDAIGLGDSRVEIAIAEPAEVPPAPASSHALVILLAFHGAGLTSMNPATLVNVSLRPRPPAAACVVLAMAD